MEKDMQGDLKTIAVQISNYKCFGEDVCGYDGILPVNLIIGRNNSGKSSLLDLIEYVTAPKDLTQLGHNGLPPKILLSKKLSEGNLRRVFNEGTSGGPIRGNHWQFGKKWIDQPITWEFKPKKFNFVKINPPFEIENFSEYEQKLANSAGNPFSDFVFKRLLADRDITPEQDLDQLQIQSNGQGVTNAIQNFINKAYLPSALIENKFLSELNSIFEPDGHFTDIVTQKLVDGRWEIYLEEDGKGRVPLSHTGSGLKTIILVLAYLYLIPHIENKPLSKYFFGLEELENNLHPALQRRLLLQLRKAAIEQNCIFFLTTHSSVAIDLFSSDDVAQIIHVTHNSKCASTKRVTTYVDNKGILDDLDVRASDLLQANGIVWLEGPSDRLYFNRWVELWSNGKLKEGANYQCVFYGGRLLSHLSASDPEVNPDDVVKILRINRNALVLIDSDKEHKTDDTNATKKRIVTEIEALGGKAWLTAGREVENYIPTKALASFYKVQDIKPLGQYQDIATYLDRIKDNEGKRFLRKKVIFAGQICPFLTKDDLGNMYDLDENISTTCDLIRRWNGQ